MRGARVKLAMDAAVGLVPRLVFGNYAGVSNNVKANREWRDHQRASKLPSRPVDPAAHATADLLRRDAAGAFDAGYDRSLLLDIQSQYRRLIEDPAASSGPASNAYRHLVNPVQRIPAVKQLLNERVRAVLYDFYGSYFQVESVRAWRTNHVPSIGLTDDVYSNTWHTDQCPVTSLRLFVYLSDEVTKATGAFQYRPSGETTRLMRSPGYLSRALIFGDARRQLEDLSQVRYFEGGLGSTCFCNVQLCLHRAGVPGPGKLRDVAQFYISPSASPLADDWDQHLKQDSMVG